MGGKPVMGIKKMVGLDDEVDLNSRSILLTDITRMRRLNLSGGKKPSIGDRIVTHPTQSRDGGLNNKTHGLSYIEEGDRVILKRLKSGELAGLRGAPPGTGECRHIPISAGGGCYGQHTEKACSGCQSFNYTIQFGETFYRQDHDLNLNFKFNSVYSQYGYQCWYPYGGVWLGFSSDGANWTWCAGGGDPYLTITGPPIWVCGPYGFDPDYSDFISMGDEWCYPDALNVNACNGKYGPGCGAPVGMTTPINYLHVHIRHNSSLTWNQCSKTTLAELHVCRGVANEVDPCPRMMGDQTCV